MVLPPPRVIYFGCARPVRPSLRPCNYEDQFMLEESPHTAAVDGWLERLPERITPEQLVSAFEQAVDSLWRRTEFTLGSITLSAIVARVLHDVSGECPLLATLKLADGTGIQFDELRQRVRAEDVEHLRKGMRRFLLQFVGVIGNLTGQILTPALHAELQKTTPDTRGGARRSRDHHPDDQQLEQEGGKA